MKTVQLLISGSLVALGAVGLSSTACDQPLTRCYTSSDYIVTYTKLEGPSSCDALTGEKYYLGPYFAKTDKYFPNSPDFNDITVGIRPAAIGNLYARAEEQGVAPLPEFKSTNAIGKFGTVRPDPEGFCTIPTLTQAVATFPEIPEVPAVPATDDSPGSPAVPGIPATTLNYEFTNFRLWVRADAVGVVWQSDVTRTETVNGTATTCKYKAYGLSPPHSCDDGTGQPNEKECEAAPDPDAGRFFGSGINVDFKVKCDPVLLTCVPATDAFPPLN
jgi:hypothetical protein